MQESPAHDWQRVLDAVISSNELFVPQLTRYGLEYSSQAPRAVYMGIGLCTRDQMTTGLPIDVLGMLIPAEKLRAAIGAEHLVVLIADSHALSNGFPASKVAQAAQTINRVLLRIRAQRKLHHLRIVRASELQKEAGYQSILEVVRNRAQNKGNEYIYRQTTDVAFLDQELGGLLKLGWTVDVKGASGGGYGDEVSFDRAVELLTEQRPCFAYVRCGRALDDRRPKVSPYIGTDRGRRIVIDRHESVADKLLRARHLASSRNTSAFREHLNYIANAWGAKGDNLETRVSRVLDELFPSRWSDGRRPQARPISAFGALAMHLKQ